MKQKIEQLIQQHKEMAQEVFYMIQELSLYDLDKLDLYEIESLELHKIALESEHSLRLYFISDLENLLSV